MLKLAVLLTFLAPFVTANLATIYWPVFSPTAEIPWIQGQTNLVSWETGGGTGVEVFDIQLHNINEDIMHGFLPIALRVPMERKGRRGNWGGSLEVNVGTEVTAGPGYVLIFMQTLHGQVYSRSKQFSILAAPPANYSSATNLPTATVTATLDHMPNPTQQYAITLNGPDPDASRTATATNSIAGNAGANARRWF